MVGAGRAARRLPGRRPGRPAACRAASTPPRSRPPRAGRTFRWPRYPAPGPRWRPARSHSCASRAHPEPHSPECRLAGCRRPARARNGWTRIASEMSVMSAHNSVLNRSLMNGSLRAVNGCTGKSGTPCRSAPGHRRRRPTRARARPRCRERGGPACRFGQRQPGGQARPPAAERVQRPRAWPRPGTGRLGWAGAAKPSNRWSTGSAPWPPVISTAGAHGGQPLGQLARGPRSSAGSAPGPRAGSGDHGGQREQPARSGFPPRPRGAAGHPSWPP